MCSSAQNSLMYSIVLTLLPPLIPGVIFDQTGAPVPGAGRIDSTANPSREIQFGLKVIW